MAETNIIKPFTHPFLSQFFLVPDILPFKNEEIVALDKDLSKYEQLFLNPEVERSLISKNELIL